MLPLCLSPASSQPSTLSRTQTKQQQVCDSPIKSLAEVWRPSTSTLHSEAPNYRTLDYDPAACVAPIVPAVCTVINYSYFLFRQLPPPKLWSAAAST